MRYLKDGGGNYWKVYEDSTYSVMYTLNKRWLERDFIFNERWIKKWSMIEFTKEEFFAEIL